MTSDPGAWLWDECLQDLNAEVSLSQNRYPKWCLVGGFVLQLKKLVGFSMLTSSQKKAEKNVFQTTHQFSFFVRTSPFKTSKQIHRCLEPKKKQPADRWPAHAEPPRRE